MKKRTVETILAVLTVGLVGLDVWLASDARKGNTLSEIVWSLLKRMPFVGFVAGFVCGHLFWQRRTDAAVQVCEGGGGSRIRSAPGRW